MIEWLCSHPSSFCQTNCYLFSGLRGVLPLIRWRSTLYQNNGLHLPSSIIILRCIGANSHYRLGSGRLFSLIKSLKNIHSLRETILLLVKDPERWKMRRSIHRMGLFPISIYNHISHHRSILDKVRK